MSTLQAEFQPFAPILPPTGTIGYLEPFDGSTDDSVRVHYAAQYTLVPRVVVGRIGPDLLIVARGTADPRGDPRLTGYHVVATFPTGHRLYYWLRP